MFPWIVISSAWDFWTTLMCPLMSKLKRNTHQLYASDMTPLYLLLRNKLSSDELGLQFISEVDERRCRLESLLMVQSTNSCQTCVSRATGKCHWRHFLTLLRGFLRFGWLVKELSKSFRETHVHVGQMSTAWKHEQRKEKLACVHEGENNTCRVQAEMLNIEGQMLAPNSPGCPHLKDNRHSLSTRSNLILIA